MLVGATSKDFKKVKKDVQQPWNELLTLVKRCAAQDKDIVDTINKRFDHLHKELEEIKQNQQQSQQNQEEILQGQQQSTEKILKGIENLQKPSTSHEKSSNLSTEDVLTYSSKLRSSIKVQTEFQPKLMASHSVPSTRTDDIFTNLMIQRGQKPLDKISFFNRWEQLAEYQRPSQSPINKCQDIFIDPDKSKPNPKSILVIGKPGIGKSLFCQRIARDWADGVLFDIDASTTKAADDIDFVYLMTFRQLNLFGDEKFNFCDVLNHCSVVDEHSNINESLFEYIIEHPEKVFFILDGYDEYSKRDMIYDSSCEQKYQNNPRIKMPVAALISKVLRKKIFGSAIVMVTSRPTESDEIGGIQMDATVEITGFSVQQVEEFIGKYFQSKEEEMKTAALDHIMHNENLLSIAHIPVLCYLMCWCIEWHIESNTEKGLPTTITELYSEVVEIFELKHNCKSVYRATEIPQSYNVPPVIKSTVEKLSDLASATYKAGKIIFDEADIEKFTLTCEEVENLKSSGLITCGPSFKISPFKMARNFCFSHLTLHEYFAALGFTNSGKIPTLQVNGNEMVFQFCAGRLSGVKGGERLMEDLLNMLITSQTKHDGKLIAKCMYEYGDKAFGVKVIENYHSQFCDENGILFLNQLHLSDSVDCVALSFFIDLLSNFCKNSKDNVVSSLQPFQINGLNCKVSAEQGMKQLVESLTNECCPITKLYMELKDVANGLGRLGPYFTDERLFSLSSALPSTHITTLTLWGNGFTNEWLSSLSTALPSTHITTLKLMHNGFYDEGLSFLSTALPSTHITTLDLWSNGFTDEGLSFLSTALPSTYITTLHLKSDRFTDKGLSSLSLALSSTHITTLHLQSYRFTDKGLSALGSVLPSTQIVTLDLWCNSGVNHGFTDKGLSSLTSALPSTHIATLDLGADGITDEGLSSLGSALPSTHITTLRLWCNGITDKGLSSFSTALPSTHITTLRIWGRKLTDKGKQQLKESAPGIILTV